MAGLAGLCWELHGCGQPPAQNGGLRVEDVGFPHVSHGVLFPLCERRSWGLGEQEEMSADRSRRGSWRSSTDGFVCGRKDVRSPGPGGHVGSLWRDGARKLPRHTGDCPLVPALRTEPALHPRCPSGPRSRCLHLLCLLSPNSPCRPLSFSS